MKKLKMKQLFTSTIAVITGLFIIVLSSTSFSQTTWQKDPLNPVLTRDTVLGNLPNDLIAISDCWVIKEGAVYKMWYTCGGLNFPADTLLRSRLCYASSNDGQNWTKYAGNPVVDVSYGGAWDSLGVETATVIIDSLAPANQRYKMWYAGQYFNTYRYDIGYAYSADGINWTKHANPVMQVGLSSEWDNGFLEGPSVIKDGSTYKMWYCGYDAVVDGNGTDGNANIGYATSPDGINWTKYAANPILTTVGSTWESVNVQDPHVIKEGNQYYMWYGGGSSDSTYDQEVGFAVSNDGISWTKSPLNPVLTRGNVGDWDSNLSSFPSVLNDNGVYKMWYTGRDPDPVANSLDYYWEIGYATDISAGLFHLDQSSNNAMVLYPNPADAVLYVKAEMTDATLTVFNSLGLDVLRIENFDTDSSKLALEDLANGIYFVTLSNGTQLLTEKFVIRR